MPSTTVLAVAAGVPLVLYLVTASAYDYWLDSPELAASAIELGISHPPGHPLFSLLTHPFTWIPIGSLAFRVAVASAVFTSVATGAFFLALDRTLRVIGLAHRPAREVVALAGAWIVAASPAWWLQAIRPEVYALHCAIASLALERLVALEAEWPTGDARALDVAALLLGLGLANHHFLVITLLPVIAPTLARTMIAHGRGALARPIAFGAAGLLTYLYLPLRALANPPLALGAPTTPGRMLWVMSAEAFQKNTGGGVPQSAPARVADVVVLVVDSIGWFGLLAAVAGAYVLLRAPGTRRIGWIWIATAMTGLAARAWLGFSNNNPDALGYLMPAMAALVGLGASFVGVLLQLGRDARGRALASIVAIAFAALGVAQIRETATRASLFEFTATDVIDTARRTTLPPRAVVVLHGPQTIFRHLGANAIDASREDVTVVPVPFLSYPGMIDALAARDRELTELLREYVLQGALDRRALASLAATRPVLVELDPRIPPSLLPMLAPDGMFYRVLPDGAELGDVRVGARARHELYDDLAVRLSSDLARDHETRATLLWAHYMDAIYSGAVGDRPSVTDSATRGLVIDPSSRELMGLRDAVAADPAGEGPIDVQPFLVTPN